MLKNVAISKNVEDSGISPPKEVEKTQYQPNYSMGAKLRESSTQGAVR